MNMDFDNQLPEDDLIREFIDGLIREWKYEVRQFDVNQVEWAETLIEEIERLENLAEETCSDDSRELLFKVKQLARQAKQKSQNAIFPAERAVSQYHAPIELLDDPEAITELLGHTEQTFDRVETSKWKSRESGFVVCTHPEAFFANLSLKCTTINWTADIPRSLDLLLNAKGCVNLRDERELDFIKSRWPADTEVMALVHRVTSLEAAQEQFMETEQYDQASRACIAKGIWQERLNSVCVKRMRDMSS